MVFRFLNGGININKYSLLKQNQVFTADVARVYYSHVFELKVTLTDDSLRHLYILQIEFFFLLQSTTNIGS